MFPLLLLHCNRQKIKRIYAQFRVFNFVIAYIEKESYSVRRFYRLDFDFIKLNISNRRNTLVPQTFLIVLRPYVCLKSEYFLSNFITSKNRDCEYCGPRDSNHQVLSMVFISLSRTTAELAHIRFLRCVLPFKKRTTESQKKKEKRKSTRPRFSDTSFYIHASKHYFRR